MPGLMDLITGKTDQPGPWDRLHDAFIHAAVNSPLGGGGLARAWFKHKGYSDAQITAATKAYNQDYSNKYASAPVVQGVRSGHPLDYVSPDNIGRAATSLLGSVLGGADPTYAVGGFGKSAIQRIASQAAVQGGASVGRQKVNVNTGMQSKISPVEVLEDAGMGAAFQGGHEILKQAGKFAKDALSPADELDHTGAPVAPPIGQRQSLVSPTSEVAPPGPDGLPGNGSVQPIDPATITKVMDNNNPNIQLPEELNIPEDADLNRRQNNRDVTPPMATGEGPRVYKNFEELPTDDPDGNKYLNYHASNGQTIPIKMGIDDGTAEMAIDQFGNGANSLGPKEIRSAMNDLMDMYPEIKRFGGFRRSGAGAGRVQEITPPGRDATPEPDNVVDFPQQQAPAASASELTPAEAQDMDASADKPVVDNTGYEAHTPFVGEPNAPANDLNGRDAAYGFVKNLLTDERGSLGYKDEAPQEEGPQAHPTVQKLLDAVSAAEPIRAAQDAAVSAERSTRVAKAIQAGQAVGGGEAGFHAELGQMKGEMPKEAFTSVRPDFTQEEVDNLHNQIANHPDFSYYDKVNARTGLSKLLDPESGSVPTSSELALLSRAFPGADFTNISTKSGGMSVLDHVASVLGVARSLKTIGDLGVAFRQASPLIGTKEYWKAIPEIFKGVASEDAWQASNKEIQTRPNYDAMQDAKVAFTNLGSDLSKREEQFAGKLAENIPGIGIAVRASERGFTGFLNKVRADTFDRLYNAAKDSGADADNPDYLKQLGNYVNTMTGRGSLGETGDKAAPFLASMFFSPRLMASRLQMFNPYFYYKLPPQLQKEAFKSLLAYSGFVGTSLMVAKGLGNEVEDDPRSTDFGRIKVQNTRFDISGGFQPYVRTAAQFLAGQKKTENGNIEDLGSGYGKPTRMDILLNLAEGKLSPIASFVADVFRGPDMMHPKSITGETNSFTQHDWKDFQKNPLLNLVIPMGIEATLDALDEYGPKSPIPYAAGAAETFGIGANTHAVKAPKAAGRSGPSDFPTSGANDFPSSDSSEDFPK